jgi:hypothetical protein
MRTRRAIGKANRKGDPMKNLRVYCPLVNGDQWTLDPESGKQLIHELITDDWGAPPTGLVFEASTSDGRTVRIIVPYDDVQPARAVIEE